MDSSTTFGQQVMDFFRQMDVRLNQFEKKIEDKIEDQNEKILDIIKTNVEHGVFIRGASKMYWLLVAALVSMVTTGIITVFSFFVKH